jgi:parvulin-like peptidyl-prolyl isomerase
MLNPITISDNDIIQQVKLSCLIPTMIEGIVGRQVIAQLAAEKGIIAEPHELQQAADDLRRLNNLHSAGETWTWLQKYHLSLDEFEELAAATVLSAKLAQHLFAAQLEPYFLEHQLDYTRVVMYEIVLDDEDLAMELFYALQEGEIHFHQATHQYIQDPDLRRQGGYRGLVRRSELKPEISAAVFSAQPPQILKPIVTAQGAHLILVEELIPAELTQELRYEILSTLFATWLKQQVEQVEVIIQQKIQSHSCVTSVPLG